MGGSKVEGLFLLCKFNKAEFSRVRLDPYPPPPFPMHKIYSCTAMIPLARILHLIIDF